MIVIDPDDSVIVVPASPSPERTREPGLGGHGSRPSHASLGRLARARRRMNLPRAVGVVPRPRSVILGLLLAAPVALLVGIGVTQREADQPSVEANAVARSVAVPVPEPVPEPVGKAPEPVLDAVAARVAFEELDRWRSAAFRELDPSKIAGFALPGTTYAAEQRSAMTALAQRGLRPVGLSTKVVAIAGVAPAGRDRWRVSLTDVRSSYQLVDSGGVVKSVVPRSAPSAWLVTLEAAGSGAAAESAGGEPRWRIAEASRAEVLEPVIASTPQRGTSQP